MWERSVHLCVPANGGTGRATIFQRTMIFMRPGFSLHAACGLLSALHPRHQDLAPIEDAARAKRGYLRAIRAADTCGYVLHGGDPCTCILRIRFVTCSSILISSACPIRFRELYLLANERRGNASGCIVEFLVSSPTFSTVQTLQELAQNS